jgi:PKD repeat protein
MASGLTVTFTDLSTNNPDKWEWYFEGGTPSSSKEQNPTVTYDKPGTYDVSLTAKNDGGKNEIRKSAYINFVFFKNSLFTDLDLTFNNRFINVPAEAAAKFSVIGEYIIDCYIETQGIAPNGENIGLLLYWDWPMNLAEYSYYLLGINSDIIFFYIKNSSDYNLTHFHVNCGNSTYESYEELFIRNDRVKYGIGYYNAFRGMEVRSYYPTGYIRGIEPASLHIPWTNNQYLDLFISKSGNVKTEQGISFDSEAKPSTQPNVEQLFQDIDQSKIKVLQLSGVK